MCGAFLHSSDCVIDAGLNEAGKMVTSSVGPNKLRPRDYSLDTGYILVVQ